MANAPVTVTDAGDHTPAVGQLFKDINFFLSQRLPTRSKFVADVEANGGRVVKFENRADYVIADHLRKPTPVGSFSYTLIEQAVRDGSFPDPAEHALGQTTDSPRAAGSSVPGKRTRTAFTAEDDKVLWQWVEHAKAQGQPAKGNDIYKRLEATNPRHTWQAWRDRYVKKLIDNPPFGVTVAADASSGEDSEEEMQPVHVEPSQADFDMLWEQASDIENMDDEMYEQAWEAWAQINEGHTAVEWRQIWEDDVRPAYRKERAKLKAKRRYASISDNQSPVGTTPRKNGKKRKITPASSGAEFDSPEVDQQQSKQADDDAEEPDGDLAALKTWEESTKRKSSLKYRLEESDLPTSEANRAVDQQFQADMNGASSNKPVTLREQVNTSDANRAADLQVQTEAAGTPSKQHAITDTADEQFTTSEANRAAESQLNVQTSNGISGEHDTELDVTAGPTGAGSDLENAGHALTEANLVSQQAEHEEPLTRGADLPKDDQHKDQEEYVKYLQNVTGQPQDEDAGSEDELPSISRPVGASQAKQGAQATSNLPVSSQQEVDNVMEDAFDWPSSPQRKRNGSESQEQQFETQLSRTRLPLSKEHVRSLMPDFELSSQLSQPNDENHLSQGLTDTNDNHIDLNIPEPEGDFTFTSSPERERPVASEVTVNHAPSGVDESHPVDKRAVRTGPPRTEVVDISSDASSSSLPTSQVSEAVRDPRKTVQGQRKHAVETQDIINAETQAPDFFMPPPDDEREQGEEPAPQASSHHAKENQDIIAAETQLPDLSMPLPADWDSEGEAEVPAFSKKPKRPTKQTQEQKQKQKQMAVDSQTMDVEKELESWLDTQHVRGFKEASAIAAMQRSSMRPALAELVLLAEKGGLGLPHDIPGIWSEREDNILESGDSGALRRLEAKHGWDECDARMKFLAEWREA